MSSEEVKATAMRATPFGRRRFHQDEPQGYQVFFQMNECVSEEAKATRACAKETCAVKAFAPLASLLAIRLRWLLVASTPCHSSAVCDAP